MGQKLEPAVYRVNLKDKRVMQTRHLRVCISGTGFAGDFTAQVFRMIPHKNGVDIRLAGVTSGNLGNAERFAARHGVHRAFASHAQMLEAVHPEIDCIACANYVHGQYVEEAAQCGVKVILLEKPPIIWPGYRQNRTADAATRKYESMAALKRVFDTVHEYGAKLLYAENFVYLDGVKAIVELIAAAKSVGKGKVLVQQGVCAHQGSHAPAYDSPEKSGGGALFNKACHPLGPALYLKQIEGLLLQGKPIRPKAVYGMTRQILKHQPASAAEHFRVMQQVDDFGKMTVVFEDETIAELTGHDLNISGILNTFEVIADFGQYHVRANPNNENELFLPEGAVVGNLLLREKLPTAQGTSFPRPSQFHAHGYVNEIDDAVDCALDAARVPQSSMLLAWDTLAVLLAAYESSEQHGAMVEIGDIVEQFPATPAVTPDPAHAGAVLQRG
ncbi:MAG: Gfo/Idh/MocA family oxidoreductase [Candidatus Hydrogenedentes bacterium]|nr:Gfo/Idh/MocA family oxidoreductase [Candidatus Hydrogenedentota bacterium]